MTPFEFAIIALLVTFVLATLALRSIERIRRQSDEIELARKALVVAYANLMHARVKRAKRTLPRVVRLPFNNDLVDRRSRV